MRKNGVRNGYRYENGGRVGKMGGGMSTARKDMASGYYKDDMGMKGGAMYKKGGSVKKNTKRMNRLEELGRVDAEKARTRKGKRNLKAEKKRIVREIKKG
tara:strand:+ start:42 stop:341 length:300 start_codon:yes stop_codon:yes gene_type:complete